MTFDLTTIRVFAHLLGVTVWIGGQIVLVALLPVLRGLGEDAPRLAARRFGALAWPFFALVVVTGVWNLLEIDVADRSVGYHATLGIKLLLVALSGVAAFVHGMTATPLTRAVTGAAGLVAALGAMVCGVMMVT
ncbi:MAG: hypothetical protein S0880_04070 [Actinomycetota bacterium]|nr:hypothetical protein [Actinomycetota bacterium]